MTMTLKSKSLHEKVVESAKEVLKKVQNNAYVAKKLNAVIAAKKYSITGRSKNMLHFNNSTNCMNKVLKIWKRKKRLLPLNVVGKLD
nr:hypothetical protein [Wolbachia endosymbiont of Litomosoides brasiliensis]